MKKSKLSAGLVGVRLGPYEVTRLIGAGGMGEVYRARDTRLKRDVAVKVLHRHLCESDHIRRLTREARVTGALNHPNILAVFDIGLHDGAPYIVSELLEGESLRSRLDHGALPYRKALEYASQLAEGLAVAHAKGIYHRDVKPGNVFVTADGRIKLLDFGLAKQGRKDLGVSPEDSTASAATGEGAGLGTAGYMAPEQVRGDPVDARTDVFALGAVLYEALTGHRPFKRSSRLETLNAILNEDPGDPGTLNPGLPRPAVAVVRRCLEKNPEERFQSARDLAFQLRQLLSLDTPAAGIAGGHGTWRRSIIAVSAAAVTALAAVRLAGLWPSAPPEATFEQVTFHRGRIGAARFTPAGVVYSQARAGRPAQVWLVQGDGPEELPVGQPGAELLSARAGKLALLLQRRAAGGDRGVGTLAEVPLGGGAPRRLGENVEDADWNGEGSEIAVARSRGQGAPSRLEYPLGRVLYTSSGSILYPRVSGDGRRVVFLEDPAGAGDGGRIVIVDQAGKHSVLTEHWASARGVAWSPDGREIWYAAGSEPDRRAIRAVAEDGEKGRVIYQAPAALTLWDVASDGRVLVARDDARKSIVVLAPGATREQDLSWYDAAGLGRLSADGKTILFGDRFGVYVRPTDGSPPVRVGLEGTWADDLSVDGEFVLATTTGGNQLILAPTGPGASQPLPTYNLKSYAGVRWFPDGRRILVNGHEEARDIRSYVLDPATGEPPRPITPEGVWALCVSTDGTLAAALGSDSITLWPTAGGASRVVPSSRPGDRPVSWTSDDRALWVFRRGEMPAQIHRLDVLGSERKLWKTIAPPDLAGVYSLIDFEITPDGQSYAYSYRRVLSELYVASGLH